MKYKFMIEFDTDLICAFVDNKRVYFKLAEFDDYEDGFETLEFLQEIYQTSLITQEMLDEGRKWLEEYRKSRNGVTKQAILNVVSDCATDLLYYDRKEDDELPIGAIEKAIADGVISIDEIVEEFRKAFSN